VVARPLEFILAVPASREKLLISFSPRRRIWPQVAYQMLTSSGIPRLSVC